MSYSHGRDSVVAPIFQRELERLAKPWYQLRSSRVFRDKTNLAADPGCGRRSNVPSPNPTGSS
jgi:hypothetical protein